MGFFLPEGGLKQFFAIIGGTFPETHVGEYVTPGYAASSIFLENFSRPHNNNKIYNNKI